MNRELIEIKYDDIVFDEGLYPRVEGHDPERVQAYARDMDQIELSENYISINADNILVDGRHRQLAYKKRAEGKTGFTIPAYRYPISSKLETFRLSCELQDHGKSLTNSDKVSSAKKLYALGDQKQKTIATALSVSESTISGWLSRTRKEEKAKQKKKAFNMWLSCHTQEDIAEVVGIPRQTISDWLNNFAENSVTEESAKWTNFIPPIYNVWKKQTKTNKVNHFGNSEPQWLENLIYLYTNPSDIILDPFGGSGTTIDVCKKRGRRYWVADRKPIVEREHEIRIHDMTSGLPLIPRWKDVRFVYLDPPYWKQAEGEYSDDPTDLANMSLDDFNKNLSSIICQFSKKLSNAYIALIIQPTQWKAENKHFTDHIGDMLRMVNLPVNMRYSVPYESQQHNAQMVNWAKENKTCLVLTREIIVWEIK